MFPELQLGAQGEVVLHLYGALLGLAIVLGCALAMRNGARLGLGSGRVFLALLIGVPCGFVGARAHYALVDPAAFDGWLDLLDMRGGRYFAFGAAAGGTLGVLLSARLLGASARGLVDACAPGLALALAIGRVGCFLAGCGFGRPSEAAWAVRFPAGSRAWHHHRAQGWVAADAPHSLPVWPTQLLECAALLLLAWLLQRSLFAPRPTRSAGRVAALFVLGYCLVRLGVEFARGDAARGLVGPLSTTQWSALAVASALVLAWAYASRDQARSRSTSATRSR